MPEWVTARCTWPIDAAASGTGSHCAKTSSGLRPSSARDHRRAQFLRHRRRVLLQVRERHAHRFGQALVEVARHLAELHHGALEFAERARDVGRGLQLVLDFEFVAAIGRRGRDLDPVDRVPGAGAGCDRRESRVAPHHRRVHEVAVAACVHVRAGGRRTGEQNETEPRLNCLTMK